MQFFADQIVINKGTITLVTGGTMQEEHPNDRPGRPGETLGSGIEGGKKPSSTSGTSSTSQPASPTGSRSPRRLDHRPRLQRKIAVCPLAQFLA
jgi:hypothetical protein